MVCLGTYYSRLVSFSMFLVFVLHQQPGFPLPRVVADPAGNLPRGRGEGPAREGDGSRQEGEETTGRGEPCKYQQMGLGSVSGCKLTKD